MGVFLLVGWLATGGVGVRAGSPTVACPTERQVADALGYRLPASPTVENGWTIRYDVVGSTPARTVAFQLLAADGMVALERHLPLPEQQCLAAAATIAAVVERYFRSIGWTSGAPLPSSPRPRPLASRPDLLRLWLGPALAVSGEASAAAAVGIRVRLVGPVVLGLGLLAPPRSRREVLDSAGSAEATDWRLKFSSWATAIGRPLEWGGGLEAQVGLQAARTGGISEPQSNGRALLAVGLGAGIGLKVSPRWRLGVELAGYRSVLGTAFYVIQDGVSKDVLVPPTWSALAVLSIGYVVMP